MSERGLDSLNMSERGLDSGEVTYVRERSELWRSNICPREVRTLEK